MFDDMRFTRDSEQSPIASHMMRTLHETGDLSIASLRTLAPLPDRTQNLIDRAVVSVGLDRLSFVAELISRGLTYTLNDPLSVPFIEWESVNQTGGAQRTMTPSARGEFQMPNRTLYRLPIYLTTDDFSLSIRTLRSSQRVGTPLDTTLIEQATRRVNEAIEDAAINGATTLDGQALQVGTYTAPGLLNAPNANTYTLTADWDTATGAQIYADVAAMITKLEADKKYGPYVIVTGTSYNNALDADYKVNGDRTIRERVMLFPQIEGIVFADMMPVNTVAIVQMTSDVVQLVQGQAPTVIPWTSNDGFTFFWLVMAIQVPRFRSDYNGSSGIVIGTP